MAVILTQSSFELFYLQGRSLVLVSGGSQLPDFLHSNRLRCVDGFMIKVRTRKNRHNLYGISFWRNSILSLTLIDTPRRIAQTPIISLRCVDALRGMGLRAVVTVFAESIYTACRGCVDLTLETLAPSGLSDELPTDWVKSD